MSSVMQGKPDSFCSRCGTPLNENSYPKTCSGCGFVTYLNPIPVAVVLIPFTQGGILTVMRAIPPLGPALPGGFMEAGQSWQENAARELLEETGLSLVPENFSVLSAGNFQPLFSTPGRNLLVFMIHPPISFRSMPEFVPNREVSSVEIACESTELVFPAHTAALKAFFTQQIG